MKTIRIVSFAAIIVMGALAAMAQSPQAPTVPNLPPPRPARSGVKPPPKAMTDELATIQALGCSDGQKPKKDAATGEWTCEQVITPHVMPQALAVPSAKPAPVCHLLWWRRRCRTTAK